MRIYGPSSTRNVPFDRNPVTTQTGGNTTAAAPGGATTNLANYVVPAARKAYVTCADAFGIVTTALAAGQIATLRLYLGAAPAPLLANRDTAAAAALGAFITFTHVGLYLTAADQIRIDAVLTAGAGVLTCAGSVTIIEYDA